MEKIKSYEVAGLEEVFASITIMRTKDGYLVLCVAENGDSEEEVETLAEAEEIAANWMAIARADVDELRADAMNSLLMPWLPDDSVDALDLLAWLVRQGRGSEALVALTSLRQTLYASSDTLVL